MQTAIRPVISFGASGDLHEFYVDYIGENDVELSVVRIRFHTHIKEALWDCWVFEDDSQRVFAIRAGGWERAVFEEMHVDYIGVGLFGGVHVWFQYCQWVGTAETAAVAMQEEGWRLGVVYLREVVEHLSWEKGSVEDGACHVMELIWWRGNNKG